MWCKYVPKYRIITLPIIRKFDLISWYGNFPHNYFRNKLMTNIHISLKKTEILITLIIMTVIISDFEQVNVNCDVS